MANVALWELQGPPQFLAATQAYGEQINSPRLGHERNFYWASMQNNMANVQHVSTGMSAKIFSWAAGILW
jgi:hypothetical protein